ncbi:MAG: GntR family transcriptional regulator [Thermoanaerobaculia bacterium]
MLRANLSDAACEALREMIFDGRLAAGSRVNEVRLSAALGISRTPLREALVRLAAEGALSVLPRSGFFVRPLTLEEFREIYPIRAMLDPEALRLAGVPSRKRLDRLAALNRKLRETSDPGAVIRLDDAWHLELVDGCTNRILVALIEQFMRRTRRYELALMRERRNVEGSIHSHEAVLGALRAGDLDEACALLRRNMEIGSGPIAAWLEEGEGKGPAVEES